MLLVIMGSINHNRSHRLFCTYTNGYDLKIRKSKLKNKLKNSFCNGLEKLDSLLCWSECCGLATIEITFLIVAKVKQIYCEI